MLHTKRNAAHKHFKAPEGAGYQSALLIFLLRMRCTCFCAAAWLRVTIFVPAEAVQVLLPLDLAAPAYDTSAVALAAS